MSVHAVLAADEVAAALPVDCVAVLDEAASLSRQAVVRVAALLEQHPGVGVVFVDGVETRGAADRDGTVVPGHRWLLLAAEHGPDVLASRCAVLRRTVFQVCGSQPLGTRHGELSLWLRAAAVSDVAHVLDPVPAAVHAPATHRPVDTGEVTELHERAHAFRELLDGFAPLREQSRLRAAAYRSVARQARRRAWATAIDGDPIEASLCRHLAHDVDRWRKVR